ncbi:MAG: RpiR family transcriptional regulator [Marinosulfonomonas sp.]|nr:MAG: RpiR family transcriptional regulator [Marinosulfonomonas sp.]
MSAIAKILTNLDTMTPTDGEIGKFIIENPEEMLRLSSAALAEKTGRSQSSVVKFSQRLGYSTYQELKLAISHANVQEQHVKNGTIHGTIEHDDTYQVMLQKLIGSKHLSMQQTVAANSESSIHRTVDYLNNANRIYLGGVGASSLVARDLSYKLMKLGRNVLYDSDSHVQMASASALGVGDVMLAFSHSGNSLETVRIAETARRRGATVIAVTGLKDNPLSRIADMSLSTVADEERVRSSSITARDAQLILVDLLFILLVQIQPDANEFVSNSEIAVSVLKV